MIAVVVPEPVPWLEPLVRKIRPKGEVTLIAPWAAGGPLQVLPGRLGAFVRRRALPAEIRRATALWRVPGWSLAEGALRGWSGGRADRRLPARFALRRAVDAIAAAWVRRAGGRIEAVVAPSCSAELTFAASRRLGLKTQLIEDIVDLRGLHVDLDRAAAMHPTCRFLRNYRAASRVVARQRCERVLATEVWVRGHHALAERQKEGVQPVALWPDPDAPLATTRQPAGIHDGAVLLAGVATARHGTMEALAALSASPKRRLWIRPGEGLEPRDLMDHPRVEAAPRAALARLEGVAVVIAPAWCESYPPEVPMAVACGVPVVATGRAMGCVSSSGGGVHEIAPGDADALIAALGRVGAS